MPHKYNTWGCSWCWWTVTDSNMLVLQSASSASETAYYWHAHHKNTSSASRSRSSVGSKVIRKRKQSKDTISNVFQRDDYHGQFVMNFNFTGLTLVQLQWINWQLLCTNYTLPSCIKTLNSLGCFWKVWGFCNCVCIMLALAWNVSHS